MNLKVPKIFKTLYTSDARYKGLKGGRGSGKSWAIADYILYLMLQNQDLNTVCLREIQKSIAKSSKKLLDDRIEYHNLYAYFDILQTEIRCKQGKGVIIFQGLQDHTADSIKSLEGFDLCWIEEAQTITEFSLELLIPTIRKDNSQVLFSYNPRYANDAIELFFKDKSNAIVIHANYNDNPYCPIVIKEEAKELKEKNELKYRHVYLGEILEDDDLAIIPRKWIRACINAHIKLGVEPTGIKRIGYDVADSGEDTNVVILTHGILNYGCIEWDGGKDEMFNSSKKVHRIATEEKVQEVNYDNVGVGAGVGSNFREIRSPFIYNGFSAGEKPRNPKHEYKNKKLNQDAFKNLKAQAWQNVADRLMNTYNYIEKGIECEHDKIISISSTIPLLKDLITELSTPRAEKDGVGRFMVESKKDLAKRGVKSPNIADAFIMANFDISKPKHTGATQNTVSFF